MNIGRLNFVPCVHTKAFRIPKVIIPKVKRSFELDLLTFPCQLQFLKRNFGFYLFFVSGGLGGLWKNGFVINVETSTSEVAVCKMQLFFGPRK